MRARSSDPLSEVLSDLRLAGVSYGRCELTSPWGLEFPAQREARFHFVAEGSGFLRAPGGKWIRLEAGDAALLPHGRGHSLADTARGKTKVIDDVRMEPIGERTFRVRTGGRGARTLLACCSVAFAEPALHPLLELMPPLLLVRGAASDDPSLPALLDAMTREVKDERVGGATIMTRLADVVITRTIRTWVETRPPDMKDWLAAVRDPHLGKALAAIHREPGDDWTVEALAAVAGISRSTFFERFTAVVGLSPARYLSRWRMHLAGEWLRRERQTVAEVAARLGYDSQAAFSRAFKRQTGVPPSTLRRVA